MSDPLPILAHGESYAQPVQKKTGGGSKPRPHEYEEARNRLLANIGAVSRQMQTDPDSYLEEKVVCIRMEPKFKALCTLVGAHLFGRVASHRRQEIQDRQRATSEEQ